MRVRALLTSLQLPVAGVGLLLVAASGYRLLTLPEPPVGSNGFVDGVVAFFLYLCVVAGLIVTAIGLAIPADDQSGVRFRRHQRLLFVLAALAALAGLLSPLVVWPAAVAAGASAAVVFRSWLGLTALAGLVILVGVGWRAVEVALARLGGTALRASRE
ncbi:hypothetical protein [Salinilacihabitans rarus]|uniref:hypothetical protein n=1 Tax=Salinilacihabitans rarus TaxID=2961596 RepID=UPI0020C842FC|nr:hypothetical protein [Salinilacihabitans rarus]